MKQCEKCGKYVDESFKTAYGEIRCPDCYDDYLLTDKGKVEYLIGIVRGDYPMDYYDADFLGLVAVCWNTYKDKLALTVKEINDIEIKAMMLGLL